MTAPEVELRRTWRRLAGSGHDHRLEQLVALHRDPTRHYHGTTHVMWVLRHVDDVLRARVAEGVVDDRIDADAVRLAALFHDAVYDATRSDKIGRAHV